MIGIFKKLLYLTKGKHKAILFVTSLFLINSLLELVGIGLVGPFMALATNSEIIRQNYWLSSIYTRLNLSSENQLLLLVGISVIIVFYVKAFFNFTNQKRIFEFGYNLQGELTGRLMRAYLNAPYTYHLNKNSSIIINNITSGTEQVATQLIMPLLTTISNGVIALGLLILLLATNAMVLLFCMGMVPVAILIFRVLKDKPKEWGMRLYQARIDMHRQIDHSIGGIKETKVIGCESYFERQLRESAREFGRNASLACSFASFPRYVMEAFLITFLIGFTLLFLAFNQGNNSSLVSVLGIFSLASVRLLPLISNMITTINTNLKYSDHLLDTIYIDLKELEQADWLQMPSSLNNPTDKFNNAPEKLTFSKQIILENVTYRYPNANKNALKDISVEIIKGESIGLIGKSGAGKTTLVDVIWDC